MYSRYPNYQPFDPMKNMLSHEPGEIEGPGSAPSLEENLHAHEAAAAPPPRPVPMTIMSNFRLLAGLTTLMAALWALHLLSSAPAGTFESNFIVVAITKLNS